MPRRIAKWKQLVDIDYDVMMKMSTPELKKAVQVLQRKVRENRADFTKQGITSPAFGKFDRSGGNLRVRGKNRSQLLHEFARGATLLSAKTSTVKGMLSFEKETMARLNVIDWDRQTYQDFWNAYSTFISDFAHVVEQLGDSQRVQEFAVGIFNDEKNLDSFRERLIEIHNDTTKKSQQGEKYNLWDYIK